MVREVVQPFFFVGNFELNKVPGQHNLEVKFCFFACHLSDQESVQSHCTLFGRVVLIGLVDKYFYALL